MIWFQTVEERILSALGSFYIFCKTNMKLYFSKGCFTYTPNPNRTVTVTANELHRFVFGRLFTYEPNPWTKSKKMLA